MSVVNTLVRQYVGVHACEIPADEIKSVRTYLQFCHSTSKQDGIKRISNVTKMQNDRRLRKNLHEETCPNIRPKDDMCFGTLVLALKLVESCALTGLYSPVPGWFKTFNLGRGRYPS